MGTWDVGSAGERFLEVAGRNEILIFRVLANETGDVGAERDNPEMVGAGEIERHPGKFCGQALAFEWPRHFGVGKNDAAGKAAIGDKGAKAINAGFEAMSFFDVGDAYVVEIHVHGSPCGFAGLFIPEITERAGWALLDLFENAIASRRLHVDPRASVDVEDFAKALDALGGVKADARLPDDRDFGVRVGLLGFAHEDLRVTGQVYQGIWKLRGRGVGRLVVKEAGKFGVFDDYGGIALDRGEGFLPLTHRSILKRGQPRPMASGSSFPSARCHETS